MRDIVVFSCSSNRPLADRICNNLGLLPGEIELSKFANGEISVRLCTSVRDKDVFILQSGSGKVNDNLMELLLTISACKMASAKRITVVCPLFFYSRQAESPASKRGLPSLSGSYGGRLVDSTPSSPRSLSRNSVISGVLSSTAANSTGDCGHSSRRKPYKSWVAQSGMLIADLLTSCGADHIVTMDLHDPQFQGFFDIPVDNLLSKPLVEHYIVNYVPNYQECVIVSPDAGGAKRAAAVADSLGLQFALIHKERRWLNREKPVRAVGMGPYKVMPALSTDDLVIQAKAHGAKGSSLPGKLPSASSALRGDRGCSGKCRCKDPVAATTMLVGAVAGKECVIIDDLIDTGSTVMRAARLLKEQGASKVYAIITHGIFSGDALPHLKNCTAIDSIITTNTVDQQMHVAQYGCSHGSSLCVLDVSRMLAEAIRRINNGESISLIYEQGW